MQRGHTYHTFESVPTCLDDMTSIGSCKPDTPSDLPCLSQTSIGTQDLFTIRSVISKQRITYINTKNIVLEKIKIDIQKPELISDT